MTLPAVDDPEDGTTNLVRPVYQYRYDAYGNQVQIQDPKNRVTRFAYDHFGRQTSRTLPQGVISGSGYTETMLYNDDSLADILSAVPAMPLNNSVGMGQLEYAVDFEGRVTAFRYDNTATGGGRLVGKYFYDSVSAYTTDKSNNGLLDTAPESIVYTYDALAARNPSRSNAVLLPATRTRRPPLMMTTAVSSKSIHRRVFSITNTTSLAV